MVHENGRASTEANAGMQVPGLLTLPRTCTPQSTHATTHARCLTAEALRPGGNAAQRNAQLQLAHEAQRVAVALLVGQHKQHCRASSQPPGQRVGRLLCFHRLLDLLLQLHAEGGVRVERSKGEERAGRGGGGALHLELLPEDRLLRLKPGAATGAMAADSSAAAAAAAATVCSCSCAAGSAAWPTAALAEGLGQLPTACCGAGRLDAGATGAASTLPLPCSDGGGSRESAGASSLSPYGETADKALLGWVQVGGNGRAICKDRAHTQPSTLPLNAFTPTCMGRLCMRRPAGPLCPSAESKLALPTAASWAAYLATPSPRRFCEARAGVSSLGEGRAGVCGRADGCGGGRGRRPPPTAGPAAAPAPAEFCHSACSAHPLVFGGRLRLHLQDTAAQGAVGQAGGGAGRLRGPKGCTKLRLELNARKTVVRGRGWK